MSLNTTPRTWVTGEFVTAAMLNTEIRDALTGVQSVWTAYTPTIGGVGWALGDATVDCAFQRFGKLIAFRISITMGSTTTYAGQLSLSLPVNPKTQKLRFADGLAFDVSANGWFPIASTWLSTSNLFWTPATVAGNADRALNSSAPFVWAVGDMLTLNGLYEAA